MKTSLQDKFAGTEWVMGDAAEFLQMQAEEKALLEIRTSLAYAAKHTREKSGLTQTELAKKMRSSQSRIAKIEACDPSVSIELMLKSLLMSGADRMMLGKVVAG